MDQPGDGSPMQGVTEEDQVPDSWSDGAASNILKKTLEHVPNMASTLRYFAGVLEELKRNEGQNPPPRTVDGPPPQDKSESLEEENKVLKATVTSLQEALQSENRKTHDLHKMMIKAAGHTTGAANDTQIQAGFEKLRDEIYQVVKKHFTVNIKLFSPTASSDAPELINRAKIATKLYECFFDKQSYVFGIDPELENGLARFEREILHYGNGAEVELDEVFEWRARTVQICQGLKIAGKQDCVKKAMNQIWPQVAKLGRYRTADRVPAFRDFEALCASALDLAILLRSTKTEFEWEQKSQTSSSGFKSKEMEILGTLGPDIDKGESYTVDKFVFGGLVRGDAKTGRFRDGRVRLLKSSVLIK